MDQERYQNLVKKCTEEKLQVLNEFSYAAKTIDRDFVRFEPRTLAGDLVVVYVVRRGKNGLVRLIILRSYTALKQVSLQM